MPTTERDERASPPGSLRQRLREDSEQLNALASAEMVEKLTTLLQNLSETGERLIGQIAKRQAVLNPENTIYSAKRFIGRRYSEVQSEIKNVPYKVVAGPSDAVRFDIMGKLYAPE